MAQQNTAFSDVLAALKTEESEPTYSALARWQERYPEFHNDLEDYFANWATSIFNALEPVDLDAEPGPNERWLTDFGVAYAMQIMRRQEAGIPDNRIESLTDFERLVLTAMKAQRTPRWQYLDRITDTVREMSNHHYLRSAVLEALQSLEKRYVIFSWSPSPDRHPDESGRTYLFLSSIGAASLKQARKASHRRN
ncbi:MAG TPA: hypothetical protein VGK48_18785 [Terriglobia bacterium]|jgi:hypothetical protein